MSVYTVMLILSAVALLIASILLSMELKQYGEFPYWNTRDAAVSAAGTIDAWMMAPTRIG